MTKMRHPNIVNFVGICPLPPSILTGEIFMLASCRPASMPAAYGPQASILLVALTLRVSFLLSRRPAVLTLLSL